MKSPPRYLIAKYVPDVRRMEPVNIGVILWNHGRTATRFLPVEEAVGLVNEEATYSRWLDFWNGLLDQATIKPARGAAVPKEDAAFVDALLKMQEGNYLLTDGGLLTDKLPSKQIAAAADHLYKQLVSRKDSRPATPREQGVKLKFMSDRLFDETGLSQRKDFKKSLPVPCKVGKVQASFKFNYAVMNGTLGSVFHRVQLGVGQSVNSAAFMFEHVQQANLLKKERCAAIVRAGDGEDGIGGETAVTLEMLRSFATVINVADHEQAADLISQVAGNGVH